MEIQLTPAQEDFIKLGIQNGRFASPDEALHQAMREWEHRQRALLELTIALDASEADMANGDYTTYDESNSHLLLEELRSEIRNSGN